MERPWLRGKQGSRREGRKSGGRKRRGGRVTPGKTDVSAVRTTCPRLSGGKKRLVSV